MMSDTTKNWPESEPRYVPGELPMSERGQSRVDAGDLPRPIKDPLLISVKGLGLVTRPEFIRRGHLLGDRVGLVEVPREWIHREHRRGANAMPEPRRSEPSAQTKGPRRTVRLLSARGPSPI